MSEKEKKKTNASSICQSLYGGRLRLKFMLCLGPGVTSFFETTYPYDGRSKFT